MSRNYSELTARAKLYGVGDVKFFATIDSEFPKVNYFESLLNDKRQFQWGDLGCKLVSLIAPIRMPLLAFSFLEVAYESLRQGNLIGIILALIATPFIVLAAAIATPFIILANLVDLIGSLIHTLADACCPPSPEPSSR